MAFMVDFIGIYGGFIGIQCGFIGIQCGFYWDSIEIEWNIIHKLTYFVHVLSGNVMVKYDMSYTVWNAIPIFRHPLFPHAIQISLLLDTFTCNCIVSSCFSILEIPCSHFDA